MTPADPSPPSAAAIEPLLSDWSGPFQSPSFDKIETDAFRPAFARALAAHRGEIEAIATNAATPDFDNTITALERSGQDLARVSAVYHLLAGAHTNDALLAVEREMSPLLAAHWDRLYMDARLFARIEAIYARRDEAGLNAEQARVLDRYRTMFRRAGAGLDAAARARLAEIGERLATLGTTFSQNVLADEQDFVLFLNGEDDLAGLPEHLRDAAAQAAAERGFPGRHAITASRSSVEPFLTFARRRDLREKVLRAFLARGDQGGATDNKAIIAEMVALRSEQAALLGYANYAQYRLDDAMAKTPEAAQALLDAVWTPARARALADRDAMQTIVQEDGGNFRLAAWDWRYYAEKLCKERCDLDETEVAPYLQLDAMIAAAFETARRLFGLRALARDDVSTWHPDVRVWEIRAADGRCLGLFYGDYFSRPEKRGGAWMTTLREQEKLSGDTRPLVINVMNFSKPREGEPALVSLEDARTLFHEFGHALHALLSDVTYPMISGTNVATDFVELPSQLYEHWLDTPEILREFARHHATGAPIPDALIAKLTAARTFDQAFKTVEFTASAMVDLAFHAQAPAPNLDPAAFEARTLARIGSPEEIPMRHRSAHFTHVFSGGGYAAGYYSYMWSEVLDADAFRAFQETGDVFDKATAERLRTSIYSAGGSRSPDDAYRAFRGRLPSVEALLRKRGFIDADATLSSHEA